MYSRKTNEQFIEEAIGVHGYGKYEYPDLNYKNNYTRIPIKCLRCGQIFYQAPRHHLEGHGCPKCNEEEHIKKCKYTQEEIIIKFKEVHPTVNYGYGRVKYLGIFEPVEIYCPRCDEYFWQRPHDHLRSHGCPKCGIKQKAQKQSSNYEDFSTKGTIKYGGIYSYPDKNYVNNRTKIKIHCNICGNDFLQTPSTHLGGSGCPICGREKVARARRSSFEEFSNKGKILYGDEFSYPEQPYKNSNTKVRIICNKCGKSFMQTPANHLFGFGCPYCKSSKGEKTIKKWLEENNIKHETQKRFKDCKDKKQLPFDFYLPDFNVCIEYQGEQHYRPFYRYRYNKEIGEEKLKKTQFHDKIKKDYCKFNNITFLEITYRDDIEEKLVDFFKKSDKILFRKLKKEYKNV